MDSPHTLYRLYDITGRLLYVGITSDWNRRRSQHAADKEWWTRVSQIALAELPSRKDALNAERIAIRTERPAYNQVGAGGRPGSIVDHSPRITWYCDTCGEVIERGKGGAYSTGKHGDYVNWSVTHWSAACRTATRDQHRHCMDIADIATVDRFLFANYLALDLGLAHHSNWTSLISRAQAYASYHHRPGP